MPVWDEPPVINPAVPVPAAWLVGGIAIVVLGLVAAVVVYRWQTVRERWEARRRVSDAERLRAETLARVDATIAAFRDGALPAADAAQAVSVEVRALVGTRVGQELDTMTLDELGEAVRTDRRVMLVLNHVRSSYPVAFADVADQDVVALLESGRDLIATWD